MNREAAIDELSFSFIRSGGPGGQHANKVSSKVVLLFDLNDSAALTESEKVTLKERLSSKLNKRDQLILTCDDSRSQFKNRKIVTERFIELLESNLKKHKKRVPTRVSNQEKARRLEAKKRHGQRKKLRRRPNIDE